MTAVRHLLPACVCACPAVVSQLARIASDRNRDAFWVPDSIDDAELREIVVSDLLYFHSLTASPAGLYSLLTALAGNVLEDILGGDAHRKRLIIACGPAEIAAARDIQRLVRGHLTRKPPGT